MAPFALCFAVTLGVGAEPQRAATTKIVGLLEHVENNLRHSRYSHTTRIDESKGSYEFDCSGMVAWVLRKTAPRAQASVAYRTKRRRSLARDYYRRIAATKPGKARWGWQRVERVADAKPGDVISWLRPKIVRSHNTGHVAFVVEPPTPIEGLDGVYALRIADASRYQHERDTRRGTGRNGFGVGTIAVVADSKTGAPIAYGWVGTRSRYLLVTPMAIGRPVG